MSYERAPLYVRSYDLAKDLLVRTAKFPRHHRPSLGARIQDGALDLTESVSAALLEPERRPAHAAAADRALARLRVSLRLAGDLGLFTERQHAHVDREVAAIGLMLGGWRRKLERVAEGPASHPSSP